MRFTRLLAFFLISVAACHAHHMAVVVNHENSVGAVPSSQLAKIFRAELRKWPDGKEVVLVLHKDSSGEAATLEHLSNMSLREFRAFVAAHKESITTVENDDDVLKVVEALPGAIGLVNVRSINDQVRVLKVDGKLPLEEGYLPH